MKRLLFLLTVFIPFIWFMSCDDSNLKGWDAYLSTGQPILDVNPKVLTADYLSKSMSVNVTSNDSITIVNVSSGLSTTISVQQDGMPSSDIEINGYDSEDTNLDNSK